MYKLGVVCALTFLAYVLAVCAIFILMLMDEVSAPHDKKHVVLTYGMALFIALSCLSYIYVGCKKPRPNPLHWHGVVLMMMLAEMVPGFMMFRGLVVQLHDRSRLHYEALTYAIWGLRRGLFIVLMMQKMSGLSHQTTGRCLRVRFWGLTMAVSTFVLAWGVGAPGVLHTVYMLEQGVSEHDVYLARTKLFTGLGDVNEMDEAILSFFLLLGIICAVGMVISGSVFVIASWRAVRSALAKLIQRQVSRDMFVKVRSLVWQQFIGLLITIATGFILVGSVFYCNTGLGQMHDVFDCQVSTLGVARVVDYLGDAMGILLLSGIGALLIHEDNLAGDVGAAIRSTLHAAVLSGRADIVFEGVVRECASNRCIVSFPGKFMAEWNSLTWLCEEGCLSSACVFLPSADPENRFGRHVESPENPGKCWCHSLYGDVKPWGCMWFEVWRLNVEKAVELRLELVATFFPGQADLGVVEWERLGIVSLWDGVGLGGSQKGEVAYLNKKGYPVVYEDLEATKLHLRSQI